MLHSELRLGGRYRLDARIGAGGMGEVWRAVDEVLGRVVAVKAMLPEVAGEPGFAKRFLVEAKAMASVNHPAVASIHDYGRSDGITFLVMEFIDGESLSQVLGRRGRLAAAEVMRVVALAADGLQAVHDCGIVHRDIKPANLMTRRKGALLITDFGISRTQHASQLTASGAMLGTPTYLSPEQVLGQPATALSDVYSLGLVAYECLSGRRPFEGDNAIAVALQRIHAAPPALGGDVARPVLAVVEGALATDPGHRWPSAAALAEAARAAASAAGTAGVTRPGFDPPPSPVPQPEPPSPDPTPRQYPSWPNPVPWPGPSWPRPLPWQGPSYWPPSQPGPASRRRRLLVPIVLGLWVVVGTIILYPYAIASRDQMRADARFEQAGLAPCGDVYCPATPMCWGGLTSNSGASVTPRPVDCAEPHVWETFAATEPPSSVATSSEDGLINRPDVAQTCSADLMSSHSSDTGCTNTWVRNAWLIEVPGTEDRLMHCLASGGGETTGSVFIP